MKRTRIYGIQAQRKGRLALCAALSSLCVLLPAVAVSAANADEPAMTPLAAPNPVDIQAMPTMFARAQKEIQALNARAANANAPNPEPDYLVETSSMINKDLDSLKYMNDTLKTVTPSAMEDLVKRLGNFMSVCDLHRSMSESQIDILKKENHPRDVPLLEDYSREWVWMRNQVSVAYRSTLTARLSQVMQHHPGTPAPSTQYMPMSRSKP